MSIVTRFEAVPSRLLSIYAAVAEVENGLRREQLESWATPPSLSTRGGSDEDGGSTALFANSLSEARRLGLIEDDGDRLCIPTKARGAAGRGASLEAHFLAYVRDTLFDRDRAAAAGQTGVLYALAWLMTKSPLKPIGFSEAPQLLLREDLGDFAEKAELGSTSSFQNLLYWARYLGFVTVVGDGDRSRRAIADPTRAIAAVIDRVLPDNQWLEIEVFLSRLAAIYPVLEGGGIREEIEAHRTAPPAPDGRLSVATSLALQRLTDRGTLSLEAIADARARILDFGGSTKRVSRVRRGENA
jgi:hypothetical protein